MEIKTNFIFKYLTKIIVFLLLILICCPNILLYAQPPVISNISLNHKIFSSDIYDNVIINYSVSQDSFINIKIYNSSELCVRHLVNNAFVKSGKHTANWDGKNDMGHMLSSDPYIYTIEAKNSSGESIIYDPADETSGLLLTVKKPLLNTAKGEISYIMPKAGMVRIRAGIKQGAHLKTIIDWEPRQAGKNIEKWDGKDKSGLIDLFQVPKREIYIFAYSLADNTIILKNQIKQNSSKFMSNNLPEYRVKKKTSIKKYKHALENPAECHEPEIKLVFPETVSNLPDGTPVLNGIVPVKVVVDKKDKQRLESARFEVMFFVDTVFLFEDEEGFTPFTYMWNTQGLSEGDHILTVNIMSYDDHSGVESRKVRIRR